MREKRAKDKDDLIRKVAKDAGVFPYMVKAKDNGDVIIKSGDKETKVTTWRDSARD